MIELEARAAHVAPDGAGYRIGPRFYKDDAPNGASGSKAFSIRALMSISRLVLLKGEFR